MALRLSDFDYALPEHLIAKTPALERTASRLLILSDEGSVSHQHFRNLIQWVRSGDLLVFNNTRVMKARLFGYKKTGGRVELLVEQVIQESSALEAWVHMKASHLPKEAAHFLLGNHYIEVLERREGFFRLKAPVSWFTLMEQQGEIPLPPYLHKKPESSDEVRYQTVYANQLGAVAAPTAGLHFDEQLLLSLKEIGVDLGFITLHVGAGTFQPIKTEDLSEHKMHQEWIDVNLLLIEKIKQTKQRGGRVIAVGTTTLRALESMALLQLNKPISAWEPHSGMTNLFIQPGFEFQLVDVLITNFHLPKSSLLLLVSAFSGYHRIRQLYQIAITKEYRFFSYGDAMWLPRLKDIEI
jgi:S-adenosylmethionine:tRNA ribosyltransferase-isomerase